jgi:hypothetical protein
MICLRRARMLKSNTLRLHRRKCFHIDSQHFINCICEMKQQLNVCTIAREILYFLLTFKKVTRTTVICFLSSTIRALHDRTLDSNWWQSLRSSVSSPKKKKQSQMSSKEIFLERLFLFNLLSDEEKTRRGDDKLACWKLDN